MRLLFALFVLTHFSADCTASENWQSVSTNEQTLWRAESGDWRAEVDPSRGRLSYLGPRNGPNFLNSPAKPADLLQFGGHRVWLGPQWDWKPFWPPPRNWEMVPADSIKIHDGTLLELDSPGVGETTVAIRRTYRWLEKGRLECTVSWAENSSRGRQAMQIFQLAEGAVFKAIPKPTAAVPHGFVRLPIGPRPTTEKIFAWPPHVKPSGDHVLLQRQSEEEKFGFPVQTVSASWPEGEILLHPGTVQGKIGEDPDGGFDTQIYLGCDERPFLEMEQLTPRLLPLQHNGRVSHTVVVELRQPYSSPSP